MKDMSFKDIASCIAEHEGKKKEVTIGNIREVLKVLVDLEIEWLMAKTGTVRPPLGSLVSYTMRKYNRDKKKGDKTMKYGNKTKKKATKKAVKKATKKVTKKKTAKKTVKKKK